MEARKQGGSSPSLSSELFGPKDSSSSSSKSTGIFGSVFPPASTVMARGSPHSDLIGSLRYPESDNQFWTSKHRNPENVTQSKEGESSVADKDKNSIYHNGIVEPSGLSSSLYYGGQDVYSHSQNTRSSGSQPIFKKDGEDDPDGNNSNFASRGNWWQGSLYY